MPEIIRSGVAYEGSCSALANLFAIMDLRGNGKDNDPNGQKKPPDKPDPDQEVVDLSYERCVAIKRNGHQCGNSTQNHTLVRGLCRYHRNWRALGHPTLG